LHNAARVKLERKGTILLALGFAGLLQGVTGDAVAGKGRGKRYGQQTQKPWEKWVRHSNGEPPRDVSTLARTETQASAVTQHEHAAERASVPTAADAKEPAAAVAAPKVAPALPSAPHEQAAERAPDVKPLLALPAPSSPAHKEETLSPFSYVFSGAHSTHESSWHSTSSSRPTYETHHYWGFGGDDYDYHPAYSEPGYKKLPETKRKEIDALYKQTMRPTISEVGEVLQRAYGKLPAENPFFGDGVSEYDVRSIQRSKDDIVNMIVQLERAYPGGTLLPLGRDAVLIADILDAFYRAIGQPDRVRRLDASGTSFPHYRDATERTYEQDRPILHDFLRSNGLDLEHIDSQPPYVMMDVTSYMSTSQSRQFMRSAYRTWAKMGRDPKALLDKVAFVGITGGYDAANLGSIRDIQAAKERIRADTSSDGPSKIFYLDPGIRDLTYTTAWHKDFLSFRRHGNEVVTLPGEQKSTHYKTEVLAQQYEVMSLVQSPEFLESVKKRAAQYGFAFPEKRSFTLTTVPGATLPIDRPREPRYVHEYHEYEHESAPPPPSFLSPLMSTFVERMRSRIQHAPSFEGPEIAEEFLRDLAGMWHRHSVTEADGRAAIREMKRLVYTNTVPFEHKLAGIYRDYPEFRALYQQ
jgi:hypothetical protein